MASLWSSLEKDVFNPQKKRLLETVRVWKTGKKKKMSILCVVVDTFRPMQPSLVKVKVDRGEQYKIASRWPLAELKLVDGKSLNQASLDFDLQFDKVYKWTASSFEEKNTFIRCLWKLNHRFLTSSITFVNVPSCAAEGRQRPHEDRTDAAEAESQEELSAYQEMTPKEAADVLKLMEEYKPLVNNSVAFAEQLSNDLHVLDEANLRAIISSEKQVTQLMSSIDEALAEVARVEETLQIYDELLGSVKQQMDHIHRENSLLHRIVSNKAKLVDEILFLTTHLNLSREHCDALSQADLSSPSRVKACIAAAEALSGCMNIQIQPGYRKLQSVAEQLIMFETLKQNFENSFISHITSIFELQGNAQVPALGQAIDNLSAPSHGLHHEELVPYTPLMAWLRNANPVLFCDLPKVYAQNLSRLYDREIKAFFEQAKTSLLGRRKGKAKGHSTENHERTRVLGLLTPLLRSQYCPSARDPAVPERPMYHSSDLGYPPFEHFGSAHYCDLDTCVQADSNGLVMTPREDVLAQVEGAEQNRAPFLRFLSSSSERQRLGKALPGAAVGAGKNISGQNTTGLQESLEKPMAMGSRQQSRWSLPGGREGQEDTPDKGNVIKMLEQVLRELQPLCTMEQQFIEKFFQLNHSAADLQVLEASATKGGENMASPEDPLCTKPRSQLEEPTTQLLCEIFSCLEPELRGFLDVCNKVHPFGCLQVLVTLNDSIFEMWDSSSALPSSFLNTVLGNMLLLAKSSFNKCIGTLCKEIEEAKLPSKMKGGILPSVSRFEEFVNFSEEVFRTAQRRGELDKAHLRLAGSVFSSINSLSSANLKVNTDMVMMENFHHIHCFLCQKKIHCLEGKKREAKQRYSEHMEKYVIKYLGQPLEKLHLFFEGVKARVAQGVKEEEVSFQLAYSKQELRKVIEKYPGKEVKRALETLYRKIHKYLSPEENLLPVVWHAMEQEFLRQYQEFEDLIQRCYAGSGIAMDFTMEDLLRYFNSITLSNM